MASEHSSGDLSADSVGSRHRQRGAVALYWAVVDGEVVHVSRFAGLSRGHRPDARCPECGARVTLKLGRIRSHHVAHSPDAICSATQPETALHINAKHHIARELQRASEGGIAVALERACLAGRVRSRWLTERPNDVTWQEWYDSPCAETETTAWAINWDAVHVEARLSSLESRRVPDIVLLQNGRPVAAVEIFVTHRVDEEKSRALADLGVPWLELRAQDVLPIDDVSATTAWRADNPLPVFREGPAPPWRCTTHQHRFDDWLKEQQRIEAEEHERRRHRVEVKALRIVDVMHPSGSYYRRLYRVEEHLTDGIVKSVVLALDRRTLLSLPFQAYRKAELWRRLRGRCEHDIQRLAARHGIVIDCPMPEGQAWVKGPVASRAWHYAQHEVWSWHPLERHFPFRYRFNRADGRWFVPQDLRSVTWERPPNDPLEPHPAFKQHRPAGKRSGDNDTAASDRSESVVGRIAAAAPQASSASGGAAGAALISTGGGRRVRDDDFPWVIDEVIVGTGYRLYVVPADATHREIVIGIPDGKVQRNPVHLADQALAASGVPRVWMSPAGDWSASMAGVPWVPLTLGDAGTLRPPAHRWPGSLAEFLEALRTGDLTASTVAAWDERTRLVF